MKPWRTPYPKFGTGPGLQRIKAIGERLDLDMAQFGANAAVVVGANGKGSTAAMTAALLGQVSTGVGLFTSPHLFDLNERFRIDGEDIADDELGHHWARVIGAAQRQLQGSEETLGGFEFLFLIAADWFAARKCAFTVWEAGIGGRLDPVRVVQAKRLALTSLDFEHTELLGETLDEIARNKLDAAPPGATVYVSECCASQRKTIVAHCRQQSLRPVFVSPLDAAPLLGAHQRSNAALAKILAEDLHGGPLAPVSIAEGFARTRWPGRLEVLQRAPLVAIDVGHTPAAVKAALAGFATLAGDARRVLVCGASQDKQVGALIAPLAAAFPTVICVAARHKGAPAHDIARLAIDANAEAEIVIAENMLDAHAIALARAHPTGAILVAGGLFLAAEFKAVHLGRDPASLVFF